jgi:hypothetical protein
MIEEKIIMKAIVVTDQAAGTAGMTLAIGGAMLRPQRTRKFFYAVSKAFLEYTAGRHGVPRLSHGVAPAHLDGSPVHRQLHVSLMPIVIRPKTERRGGCRTASRTVLIC